MRIQDRPEFRNKAQVYMLSPDDLVVTAVTAMSERNFGAVIIVDPDKRPVGIVTERDFMRRLLNNSLDPRTTRLSEIMTTDLVQDSLRGSQNSTVAASAMADMKVWAHRS